MQGAFTPWFESKCAVCNLDKDLLFLKAFIFLYCLLFSLFNHHFVSIVVPTICQFCGVNRVAATVHESLLVSQATNHCSLLLYLYQASLQMVVTAHGTGQAGFRYG